MEVVLELFSQVISLHTNIKWLHIGADEVFHLGVCPACQAAMNTNGWNKTDLLLDYLCRLLTQCRTKFPHLSFIMWDDMMRSVKDVSSLQKSGIGDMVELMVWHYLDKFQLEQDLFTRYSQVFPNLWAASAFKGATGPTQQVTDINYHLQNHKAWLNVLTEESRKFKCFRGFALTGWQRYDHYCALCELLPCALPSLAACLACIKHGNFTKETNQEVSTHLGFNYGIPLTPLQSLDIIHVCEFPGSLLYISVLEFVRIEMQFKQFLQHEGLNGWMNDYQLRRNFTNPVHIENFLPIVAQLLSSFQQLLQQIKTTMSAIFFPDTVEEWLEVNIEPKIKKLTEIMESGRKQICQGAGLKEAKVGDRLEFSEEMEVNTS